MVKKRPDSIHDAFLETDSGLASKYTDLFRGFYTGTIPVGGTLDLVLTVPEGIETTGFVRITEAKQSSITSQFISCTGYTLQGTARSGNSFDRRQGRAKQSQGLISEASSLTGVIEHSPPFELYVASPAPQRQPSLQTESGILPAFDGAEYPAFRYANIGAEIAQIKLLLIWQESPVVEQA